MRSSFRRPLRITRAGSLALGEDGRFTQGAPTYLTIEASVQVLRPDEMQALPEGRRGARAVKVYSDVMLLMPDQKTGVQADRFSWQGRRFEVTASDWYRSDVISHYRAYATEVVDH